MPCRWEKAASEIRGKKIPKKNNEKTGPSVVGYNTTWPLISADAKADSSVASLVAIPGPTHQWIPTVIQSSLPLNIYNTQVFLDPCAIICLMNLLPPSPV